MSTSASNWQYGNKSVGSKIFDTLNVLFMTMLVVVTIYPFLYVLSASLSNPLLFLSYRGILLRPIGFSLRGYELVFKNSGIINGYRITIFVAVMGTICNLIMSVLFAYVLSRRGMMWHGIFTLLAVFTMYFSGGMIPTYFVVKSLNLIDNVWSLILPGLINTYYVIIFRTAFSSVPYELEESAKLDGAGEIQTLVFIMIPLIMPTVAAISLFYIVGHWNAWTNALIYIQSPNKFPLQLVLRSILIRNETTSTLAGGGGTLYEPGEDQAARELLKYCTIMVSIIPVICVYPFIQKYFTKGVMIGAIKG